MKSANILFALILLVSPLSSFGQEGDWCGMDESRNQLIKADPSWQKRIKENKQALEKDIQAWKGSRTQHEVDTVPIVVHVIHDYGSGNISLQQIRDGIRVLNEDFRRLNADTTATRALFDTIASDSRIHFELAQLDPNGNCTNGVVRIPSEETYNADNTVKSLSNWPSDQYLNFWLVNSINSTGQGTTLGYAHFPWWGIGNNYGIVERHDRFGTIGTSNSNGRTTTHEVGHCLGLYHTFQSGCASDCNSSGDQVCDTPQADHSTQGCDDGQNTCDTDTLGPSPYSTDVEDQIENYMSYDACQNMFSEGQASRMKYYLNNISELQNLTSTANLAATGVSGADLLCAADFTANKTTICVGEEVQFLDESYHGVTTWNWTLPGTPASPNTQNPSVTYTAPGVYDAHLEVGNGTSTTSITLNDYITVLHSDGKHVAPYAQDLENSPIAQEELFIQNRNEDISWQLTNSGFNSNTSIYLDNSTNTQGNIDEFTSTTINTTLLSNLTLSFDVAFARTDSMNDDFLEVAVSSNCGATWTVRGQYDAEDLETAPITTGSFTPSGSSQWKHFLIDAPLVSSFHVTDFRFKFTYEHGGGNDLYIDNININLPSPSTIQEKPGASMKIQIHPQPVKDQGKVSVQVNEPTVTGIILRDVVGKKVLDLGQKKLVPGENKLAFSTQGLESGLYFLEVNSEKSRALKKVMVRHP